MSKRQLTTVQKAAVVGAGVAMVAGTAAATGALGEITHALVEAIGGLAVEHVVSLPNSSTGSVQAGVAVLPSERSSVQAAVSTPFGMPSSAVERLSSGTSSEVPLTLPGALGNTDDFSRYKDPAGLWLPLDDNEVIEHRQLPDRALPAQTPPRPAIGSSPINYKILSVIPKDDTAFRNIFGTEMSLAAKNEMEKYHHLFGELQNSTILDAAGQGESDFKHLLEQVSDKRTTIIIIGHSEEINATRHIVLPNGQAMSVSDIHESCLALGVKCLVLTCYSDDFRLGSPISLEDAYQMTITGITHLEAIRLAGVSGQAVDAQDNRTSFLSDYLIDVMRTERTKRHASHVVMVGLVVPTVLVGGGVIYIEVSQYKATHR